jgi:transcriptional regulator with XRE-family HTH domain
MMRRVVRHRASEDDHVAGRRLRQLRLLRGVSQLALGEALGISFQAVQKYENGENRMCAGRIASAAKFFRVSVMEFFGPVIERDDPQPGISAEALVLAGRIERLPQRHKETVRNLVAALGAP